MDNVILTGQGAAGCLGIQSPPLPQTSRNPYPTLAPALPQSPTLVLTLTHYQCLNGYGRIGTRPIGNSSHEGMMDPKSQRILLIEDNPGDARLIRHYLHEKRNTTADLLHVTNLAEGIKNLDATPIDAILLNLNLPDSQGLESLTRLHQHPLRVPVIVLTSPPEETMAARAVNAGAQDYLIKDELSGALLVRTLDYAIERHRLLSTVQNQARARTILSECNQALAAKSNEADLLERICHILVDTGGYRRAWIGFSEGINGHLGWSVASAGRSEETLAARHAHKAAPYARRARPSLVTLPLALYNRIQGVLVLEAAGPITADSEEQKLLAELVADLSYGLETLRTRAAQQQAERRIQAFATLGRDLSAATTVTEVARLVVKVADELLGWDACVFELYNAKTDTIQPVLTMDTLLGERIDVPPSYSGTPSPMARQTLDQGGILLLRDLPAKLGPDLVPFGDTGRPSASLMFVPVRDGDYVTGLLSIQSYSFQAYNEEDLATLQALADHCGGALDRIAIAQENARLFEETRQRARQVRQIIDSVPEGVLLLDSNYHLLLANPTAENYLTSLATRLDDGRLTHLLHKPTHAYLQPAALLLPWQEVTDGQRIFRLAVRPMGDAAPGDGWLFVLREITEERQQEEYAQAQERLAVVGQLAAGIAHDFNNIMAVIVLDTSLILKTPDLSAKNQERLRTIYQQAQRASNLIRQILDFSRRSVLERSALDFLSLLKELSTLLRRTLPESVRVELDWAEADYMLNGDPTRLQQIVMNLAVNARDALPNGGTLRLRLHRLTLRPDQSPPLPDLTPGEWTVLTVSDNGSGIDPEHLPHIFEPFFTTKEPGQGTGLGLAQVYGIVKQHEGFINVDSQPGAGSVFTIYLPALPVIRPVTSDTQESLLLQGQGEMILVVEDEETVRQAISEVLQMLNYQVLTAEDGQAALALFTQAGQHIDLVLSDVVMPTMGGSALHTRLKELQPDVKMVLMTGYPLKEEAQKLASRGITGWMQKPVEVNQLAAIVRRALLSPGGIVPF